MTGLRGAIAGSLAVALAVGAIAWLVGVTVIQSTFLATTMLILAAGRAIVALQEVVASHGDLPPLTTEAAVGAHREVLELSWRLAGRRNTVTPRAVERLRDIATVRLAHQGVDLDDPAQAGAVDRLLGAGARDLLATRGRPVRYRAFTRCVRAVEHLEGCPRAARGGTAVPVPVPTAASDREGSR